jgi:transaldolase
LCDDAHATIQEGIRLHQTISRDNVMIKVPATPAGYEAMEALVSQGIAVNATLIFKKEQAVACANAFARGVAQFGKKVDTVISVFVSRVDRAIDHHLIASNITPALTGIYNSASIYAEIEAMGVLGCRTLFASTGVKDDSLEPHYYIEKLLAYNSVNTAPIETILSFDTKGVKQQALPIPQEVIDQHMQQVQQSGINLDEVLDRLIVEGLDAFKEAFDEILEAL